MEEVKFKKGELYMKSKIFNIVALAICGCFLLAGCKKQVGTPEDNAVIEEEDTKEEGKDSYVFGYSSAKMEESYYEILKESIKDEIEGKGDTFIVKNPENNVEVQNQQLLEMIEEGVDAVFLCPVDWEQVTPALEALKEAGIPVVNIDAQVKDKNLISAYVGSDNKNAGAVCGEDLISKLPEGGKVVILESQSQSVINARITGFEETIKNKGFEVAARADVQGSREIAKETMLQILSEHEQIDAVMCGNDEIALGVQEAAKQLGVTGFLIYGSDGSPELRKELVKSDSLIEGAGMQSPIRIGKEAASLGISILKKEKYEDTTYIETFFINKENVEMYGIDGWQ